MDGINGDHQQHHITTPQGSRSLKQRLCRAVLLASADPIEVPLLFPSALCDRPAASVDPWIENATPPPICQATLIAPRDLLHARYQNSSNRPSSADHISVEAKSPPMAAKDRSRLPWPGPLLVVAAAHAGVGHGRALRRGRSPGRTPSVSGSSASPEHSLAQRRPSALLPGNALAERLGEIAGF
jgi:hypothetical protein